MSRDLVRRGGYLVAVFLLGWSLAASGWTAHVSAAEANGRKPDTAPQVFLLGTQFSPIGRGDPNRISGALHREIVRQGLLIAARDELGLPTRDETLREPFVDVQGKELVPLEMSITAGLDGVLRARLRRAEGDKQQELWRAEYSYPMRNYFIYLALLKQVEPDSRMGMVEALRKAGYGAPKATRAGAAKDPTEIKVPEKIEQLLSVMDFTPQFAAVRWAHRTNREQGQSLSSLGVLVRGYAHLGMLAEYFFNSMSRTFQARSLLYAERMVAAYPNSSEAFWYRAYARAVVGLHGGALSQLEEITQKFGQKEPPVDRLPACMKLIEPCCRFDSEGLLAAAGEDQLLLPLAHFLNYRVALAINDMPLLLKTSESTLKRCPAAYEIYDELGRNAPLGIKRWGARAGPAVMATSLPAQLGALEELPPSVKSLLGSAASGLLSRLLEAGDGARPSPGLHRLAAALVDAGRVRADIGEASWAVLGRMIQEVNFLQSVQILHDLRNAVETPLADVVDQLRPLVQGHPYAAYVESFRVERDKEPAQYAAILKQLRIVDPQFHMFSWFQELRSVQTPENKQLSSEAIAGCNSDFTAYSQMCRLRYPDWSHLEDQHRSMIIGEFKEISPQSPEALRAAITLTRDPSEKQLLEWEDQAKRFPWGLQSIGQIHVRKRSYDAAVRCFKKSIAISRSLGACFDLADAYDAQGKPELWQPTLEEYLKVEDFGMGHAQVHSAIAHRLMDQQKWKEAELHAVKAAETYSAWGMICAARCYEGLSDWERSELWIRRASESYSGSARAYWYLWCRRNGRGDLEAARRLAREYFDSPYAAVDPDGGVDVAIYHFLEGDRRKALELLRQRVQVDPRVRICAPALVLAAELKDQAVQEEVCQVLRRHLLNQDAKMPAVWLRYARVLEATLRPKDPSEPDLTAMGGVLRDMDLQDRADVCYPFGRLLELRGRRQNAFEYYRQALATRHIWLHGCTLAGRALQEIPGKDKESTPSPK